MTRTMQFVANEDPSVTRVEARCNGCGRTLDRHEYSCPVRYQGGYDSDPLTDLVTYSFDLCEPCLTGIMDGLLVPPTLDNPTDETVDSPIYTYAEDRRRHAEHVARQLAQKAAVDAAVLRGVCSRYRRATRSAEPDICGRVPVGTSDGMPACLECLRSDFGSPFTHDWPTVRGLKSATAARTALNALRLWREGAMPQPSLELVVAELQIATALVLLGTAPELALRVLESLAVMIPGETRTRDAYAFAALPMLFSPSASALWNERVSDWLYWGKRQGYRNAVAAVELRLTPEAFWRDGAPDDAST